MKVKVPKQWAKPEANEVAPSPTSFVLPVLYTYADIVQDFNTVAEARGFIHRYRLGPPLEPLQCFNIKTPDEVVR